MRKVGIPPKPQYFDAARPNDILLHMAPNLVNIARDTQQPKILADLLRLLEP